MRGKMGSSLCAVLLALVGCGGDDTNTAGAAGAGAGAFAGVSGGGAGFAGGVAGSGAIATAGTGGTTPVAGTGGGAGTTPAAGTGGTGDPPPIPDTFAQQFPEVTDWAALEIIYAPSYSGFDGAHVFKLPMRARCTPLPLSAWHAEPATAVAFDADPDNADGVMVTIVEPVAQITIAAVDGMRGGKAPLYVTVGTPEQWALGETRYNTGSDWMLNILAPMAPPPDTKCTVCHSPNSSSGFDVAHTPTQAARISDEAMVQIMTTGSKPADVPYRVIPDTIMFGGTTYTNAELYAQFHLWQANQDQLTGMLLYLRSLTPAGQGCVTNPLTGVCEDVAADPALECM